MLEGPGLGKEKWSEVKEKIDSKSLTYNDIDGTSLVEMLNAIYSGYDGFENSTQLCEDLSDLAMTNYPERYFYALQCLKGLCILRLTKSSKLHMKGIGSTKPGKIWMMLFCANGLNDYA